MSDIVYPHFCQVGDVVRFKKGDKLYKHPKSPKGGTIDEIVLKRPRRFLVVEARLEGGGTGMGPHDIFPDGWHLDLITYSNGKVRENDRFSCYQSGCFTIVHDKIEKVGKMKIKWVPA